MYKLSFLTKAEKDILKLDKTIQIQVIKKLEKITENPEMGDNLIGNLAGYKKTYVSNKKIRIIYKIIDKKIEVLIIAIGKRENKKVYIDAFNRIR